jgi:peroxiredoxin Q/BCP
MPASDLAGRPAPDFALDSSEGPIRLSELRGRTVVLYFFPKADTPGCTAETCAFRDLKAEFETLNAVVLGISRDSVEKQRKFAQKYHVTFPLLADPASETCQAYEVLAEKNMFGRKYIGIERTTFVIDGEGRIVKVYPKVKVWNHAKEILNYVRSLA